MKIFGKYFYFENEQDLIDNIKATLHYLPGNPKKLYVYSVHGAYISDTDKFLKAAKKRGYPLFCYNHYTNSYFSILEFSDECMSTTISTLKQHYTEQLNENKNKIDTLLAENENLNTMLEELSNLA